MENQKCNAISCIHSSGAAIRSYCLKWCFCIPNFSGPTFCLHKYTLLVTFPEQHLCKGPSGRGSFPSLAVEIQWNPGWGLNQPQLPWALISLVTLCQFSQKSHLSVKFSLIETEILVWSLSRFFWLSSNLSWCCISSPTLGPWFPLGPIWACCWLY